MISFINHIKEKVLVDSQDTLTTTAATSFLASMSLHAYTDVSKDSLRMWVVDMALNGLKVSTRKKYYSRIYTIYRDWKCVPGENPFETVKDVADFDFQCDSKEANMNYEQIDRLLYRPKEVSQKEYINLFLYLFYNPMATMQDVINMKFDDYDVDCPQIDEIIDEQKDLSHRNTNVFGLGRGRKREPQILRETLSELSAVANMSGMRFVGTFTRNSIISIWIAAAIRSGVSIADIRSVICAVPSEYSSLRLVPVVPLSYVQKRNIIRQVADAVNNRPQQWFVMKMRTGQTPDTVKNKIKMTTDGIIDKMLFYYPTHKVIQQNAKGKTVKRDIPYVPGVLFFKISRNKVPLLMHCIGEVAWCYKYSNSAGSKYCTISRNEMKTFQRCIGEFTPDVEMELEVREKPLKEGTIVKINGGGRMIGKEAVIESVKNVNGTRTYTLSLTNYLQAKWTVKDMEEIYIEPVK